MVKIIADSTCDLSEELQKQYEITILPLHILLGEEEYEDGYSITPDEIYRWSDQNSTTPKTSAPSIDRAVEVLRPYTEAGREVVYFSIAAGMSASGNIMRMAAEELDAEELVTVIDSANLSTGIGLLVLEAAILAKDGETQASGTRKLCRRYTDLPSPGRPLQRSGGTGRRSTEASSENCGGKRENAPG